MPRKRMIDPSIWTDEGMAALTSRQQLLYIGLFSNADDDGRLKGSATSLRLILPTLFDGSTLTDVETDLAAVLREMRQLTAYHADGRRYLAFRNYRAWQRIEKPTASVLPPPPEDSPPFDDHSTTRQQPLPEASPTVRPEEKGREEKLEERKRSEEDASAAGAAASPPVVAVPAELEGFDAALQGLHGYGPTEAFFAQVLGKYRGLDLTEEAIKMADWLRQPKQQRTHRQCNSGFVLTWLGKALREHAQPAVRAGPSRNGQVGQQREWTDATLAKLRTLNVTVDEPPEEHACSP